MAKQKTKCPWKNKKNWGGKSKTKTIPKSKMKTKHNAKHSAYCKNAGPKFISMFVQQSGW